MKELFQLQEMSNRYGSDSKYVLAGGGNTSFKTADTLYVKGSGTSLATIKAEDFVNMNRSALAAMWDKKYPENEAERESAVLADMMDARKEGENRRPSVETLLHNLFPQKFVLHVHPSLVNGMTCGINGKQIAFKLFPDCVWVDACRPGYILAALCHEKLTVYKQVNERDANLLFLQNHGVFFAGNSVDEIDALVKVVMDKLDLFVKTTKKEAIDKLASTLVDITGYSCVEFITGVGINSFDPDRNSPTPDHIVYCKANYFSTKLNFCSAPLKAELEAFKDKNGYYPRVVIVRGVGAYMLSDSEKQLGVVKSIFLDQVAVCDNAEAFGGYFGMSDDLVDFIVNWEVESYRSKVSSN